MPASRSVHVADAGPVCALLTPQQAKEHHGLKVDAALEVVRRRRLRQGTGSEGREFELVREKDGRVPHPGEQ